jgi:hypothetical protein
MENAEGKLRASLRMTRCNAARKDKGKKRMIRVVMRMMKKRTQ